MNITSFISTISVVLWPIKWLIEALLVGFHWFWTVLIGLNPDAGLTWILSILGLVIVVRAALIPVTLRMIKSQRRMMEVAPQIKKIQDKYKGKKDQFSREAMSRETMALYKNTGTNPFSSCLPLLIQMPVFLSLTATLTGAQAKIPIVVGLLGTKTADGKTLAYSFGHASLFNVAPLHDTLQEGFGRGIGWVIGIAIGMIILMSATQFITQLQIMSKNQSPEMKASPTYRQQRILLYILPFIFIFSGFTFPLGVMFYWVFGNLWTMGQQFIVIRNMPNPGSDAALAREARMARRRQRRPQIATEGAAGGIGGFSIVEEPKKVTTQRQQPVGKNRAKKSGNSKKMSDVTETETVIDDEAAIQDEAAAQDDQNQPAPSASELEAEGDIAADYIEELLDIADLDGDIDIDTRGGRAYLSVSAGEGTTNLRILSKPDTVNALQELTRIAVQTKTGSFSRLILDVGGSRDARASELATLVDKAVARIDEGAESASLPAMSSYERKLVHDIVAERGFVSESEGEGRDRHTVITRAK